MKKIILAFALLFSSFSLAFAEPEVHPIGSSSRVRYLKAQIIDMQASLPISRVEGIAWTDVKQEGSNLISFTYVLTDNQFDPKAKGFDKIKEAYCKIMKEAMCKTSTDVVKPGVDIKLYFKDKTRKDIFQCMYRAKDC